jgi:ribosome-associated protein
MILIEDKGQKENQHKIKNYYWQSQGIDVVRYPLPVGDYVLMNDKIQDMLGRKANRGIEPKKMDFLGTYNVCCDTKKDIQELVGDICGKQHDRFRDECLLAQNNGIKLYILVENESFTIRGKNVESPYISRLEDLHKWVNPRLWIRKGGKQAYPNATRGITLQKACYTMQKKYGVEFVFCTPKDAGRKVIELLGGNQDGLN